jgi:hypothetical protein
MRFLIRTVVLTMGCSLGIVTVVSPAQAGCTEATDLLGTKIVCVYTGQELQEKADSEPDAVYTVFQACLNGTSGEPEPCSNPIACTVGEATGTLYGVRRNGVPVGTACLTQGESTVFTPPVAVLVSKRFKALEWPKSTLTVQPEGGKTLVNFETIFYTTNSQPTSKIVTLLAQTVEIQATPTSYIWHFGDDASVTTTSAGNPYPAQDVVHTYPGLDPVEPSVDTVYSGRFRVNGGEWESIDETVTVVGDSVDLTILEASPELVTDPGE